MGSFQCINSVDRALLNEGLLDEASAIQNIKHFFEHKVQTVDFDQRVINILDMKADKDVRVKFDFCIGADGSYSVVRRQLMRIVRLVLIFCVKDSAQIYLVIMHQ